MLGKYTKGGSFRAGFVAKVYWRQSLQAGFVAKLLFLYQ